MRRGKVYIVGAGPGDPELITMKGVRTIREADIIFYDRLINKELLDYAKEGAKLVYCGKQPNHHALGQETINRLLAKHALEGKTVTRLKGGDPFVFGRGGEEAEHLANYHIDFEIVPGITSGIAAPAYAGIPITHRDHSHSFAVVTGHSKNPEADDVKWENLAKGVDTLAIYMGMKNLPHICGKLKSHGKSGDTPAALIHWGTTEEQRTVTGTLDTIVSLAETHAIRNPSMIVVGDVVKLSEKLSWFAPGAEAAELLESQGE